MTGREGSRQYTIDSIGAGRQEGLGEGTGRRAAGRQAGQQAGRQVGREAARERSEGESVYKNTIIKFKCERFLPCVGHQVYLGFKCISKLTSACRTCERFFSRV